VTAVIEAAADLQAVWDAERWRYCFIGGLAVLRWGEPRETIDVDLTLLTGFKDEARDIKVLIRRFAPRRPDAAEFARTSRVPRRSSADATTASTAPFTRMSAAAVEMSAIAPVARHRAAAAQRSGTATSAAQAVDESAISPAGRMAILEISRRPVSRKSLTYIT
jgi:hypothetical protein